MAPFHRVAGGVFHVMTYSDKLKDPKWQKFRCGRLEAANWKCEHCCSDKSFLHVHHMFYLRDRRPWEYPPEAVVVLCERCHEEWHANEYTLKLAFAKAMRLVPGKRLHVVAKHILEGCR